MEILPWRFVYLPQEKGDKAPKSFRFAYLHLISL